MNSELLCRGVSLLCSLVGEMAYAISCRGRRATAVCTVKLDHTTTSEHTSACLQRRSQLLTR
jgi:hypothetical protein